MSVVGSISIRDNASSVLKSIRQEQTALRKDAAETRKELQRAWDKTYTAKINTESATRKTDGLTGKVKQLGKTVISPVIKAKDAASATITKVSNGIKTVGKKVATPVIKIKDSATSKVKSIKNALTGVAKKVTTPVIKLKDAITSKATKITGKLKALGSPAPRSGLPPPRSSARPLLLFTLPVFRFTGVPPASAAQSSCTPRCPPRGRCHQTGLWGGADRSGSPAPGCRRPKTCSPWAPHGSRMQSPHCRRPVFHP